MVVWILAAAFTASTAPQPCHSAVRNDVLPVWARGGFSESKPRMPHVLGRSGEIAALVFGYPLLSPPSAKRSNKILWVARRPRRPYTDLRISAQRMAGSRYLGKPVARVVKGGPGPSIVDLPAPGCWRLKLRWSGRSDSLDLEYRPRA
jgi:hypothetical protein